MKHKPWKGHEMFIFQRVTLTSGSISSINVSAHYGGTVVWRMMQKINLNFVLNLTPGTIIVVVGENKQRTL